MYPVGIAGSWVGKTGHGAEYVGEPGRGSTTGVLYQAGVGRMLERSLGLTIVVESKFVDSAVVDRPRVADIPLLKTLAGSRRKSRHVSAGSLELREGRD